MGVCRSRTVILLDLVKVGRFYDSGLRRSMEIMILDHFVEDGKLWFWSR